MKHINTITLCKEDYATTAMFESEVKKAVILLLNAHCVVVVEYSDSREEVRIEYGPDNQSFGCDYPRWLSPAEYESVVFDVEEENDGQGV